MIGEVIFCDDIRQEVDGRFSLMGIIPDVLEVRGRGSGQIRTLVAYGIFSIITKAGGKFTAQLIAINEDGVEARLGEEIVVDLPEPPKELAQEEGALAKVNPTIIMNDIEVEGDIGIAIRATFEDEPFKTNVLAIRFINEAENSNGEI